MQQKAYLVVPFERIGVTLGPRQAIVCSAPVQARVVAQQIASRVAGVAILMRETDPDTGDDRDTVIAEVGAVPPAFPTSTNWSVRLN
jgi:hypothetical protein